MNLVRALSRLIPPPPPPPPKPAEALVMHILKVLVVGDHDQVHLLSMSIYPVVTVSDNNTSIKTIIIINTKSSSMVEELS